MNEINNTKLPCTHENGVTYLGIIQMDGDPHWIVSCETCDEYGTILLQEAENIFGMTKEEAINLIKEHQLPALTKQQETKSPADGKNTFNPIKSMTCPMCEEGKLRHKKINQTDTYSCGMCSFFALEYINVQNIADITKLLDPDYTTVKKQELQDVLDGLLTIAENHYPMYSSSDAIMQINDFYKKHLG